MTYSYRKVTKLCFTIVCTITVAFMMGYWFYKYEVEDRDIGVVDYAKLEDAEDIKFPDVSICIGYPFHRKNLKAINSSIFSWDYQEYLAGELYDKMYEEIDYANVTLDLNQYFKSGAVSWQDGTSKSITSDGINYINTFNGFHTIGTRFLKCFTMILNVEEPRRVKEIMVDFDKRKTKSDRIDELYIIVHYPSQFFLLNSIEMRKVPIGYQVAFTTLSLEKLEILKQRNSRHRKCFKDIDNYDKAIVDEVLHKTGCRPPYLQSHQSYPKCKTQKDIKNGTIDILARKRVQIPNACLRISEVRQNFENANSNSSRYTPTNSPTWTFVIAYPEEVKIITQSKDVDVHSLIGNIGGYLGLFLGDITILIQ